MADINLNFGSGDLEKLEKIIKEIQKTAKSLTDTMKKTGTVLEKDYKLSKQMATSTKKLTTEKKKLTAVEREQLRQEKALETIKAKTLLIHSKTNREVIKQQAAYRKLTTEIRNGGKATNVWSKALGSFQFKFNALGNIAANVVTRLSMAFKEFISDSVRMASEMQGVKRAFDALGRPGLLKDLQEATRGTVTNLELMKKAVQAKNFKIPLEKLATFFEFATSRAIQTGESVDYLVQSIITGIGRKSVLVMDNLGISAVELQEEVKKVGDFGKAAANIIEREMKSAGEVIDTMATNLERIATSWDNLKESAGGAAFGGWFGRGMAAGIDDINRLLNSNNKAAADGARIFLEFYKTIKDKEPAEQLAKMQGRIAELREGIEDRAKKYRQLLKDVDGARGKEKRQLNDQIKQIDIVQENNIALLRIYEGQITYLEDINEEVDEEVKKVKTHLLPAIKEIKDVLMDLSDVQAFDIVSKEFFSDNIEAEIIAAVNNFEWLFDSMAEGSDEATQQMIANARKRFKAEDDANKGGKASFGDYIDFARNITNSFSDLFAAAKAKELSAVGDNAAKRLAIERKYAKKEQSIAIATALMNGAEAITEIWSKWAENPAVAAVFSAISAGVTAAQVGIIRKQTFAKGGIDIEGPSHARGGIAAEIEGGESVINKRSTSKYKDLLRAINEDDQMRIMDAMGRDRKITVSGSGDIYNKKMYELMKSQHNYGEDSQFYYKQVGNTLYKTKK